MKGPTRGSEVVGIRRHVQAKGGSETGPSPVDRGRLGSEHHLRVDGGGTLAGLDADRRQPLDRLGAAFVCARLRLVTAARLGELLLDTSATRHSPHRECVPTTEAPAAAGKDEQDPPQSLE